MTTRSSKLASKTGRAARPHAIGRQIAGDPVGQDYSSPTPKAKAIRSSAAAMDKWHAGAAAPSQPVRVDADQMMPDFERLVADAVAQVEACPAKPDTTFDGYESLLAALRSATTLEGTLLERGIALVAAANPDLTVIALDRPLPVHETAKAVFRRNDWSKASGLRLDSEVATREFYNPDLLIVDGPQQLALIIDVKRSVASYKTRTLAELRSRMMAAALVTRDVLERDHDAPPVARADIAIIDGAGDCRDEAKGIFTLADLDWMLRIERAAAAITRLRDLYGAKVRAVLDRRCEAIIAERIDVRRPDAGRHYGQPEHVTDGAVDGDNHERRLSDNDDIDEELDVRGDDAFQSLARARVPAAIMERVRPRVTVGIASRRMH